MEKRILESIVELTEKQDIDSLELSLLTSLVELLRCPTAAIYELDNVVDSQVNTALLVTNATPTGEYIWVTDTLVDDLSPELASAVRDARKTKVEEADGTQRLWLPVSGGGKQVCLFIECQTLQPQQSHFVEAIVQIYGNYLRILVESERDKLTGLLNRHSFDRRLKQILVRQRRLQDQQAQHNCATRRVTDNKTAWLAMVDIDHFKQVNDRFGHVCGDEVLLALAQKMQGFFRKSDVMFRFGGEEFVLILAPSTREDAHEKLDNFRIRIENTAFPLAEKLTVSIGFTAITEEYQQLIIERADKALYHVKEHGRNNVVCFDDIHQQPLESSVGNDVDLF